MRPRKRASDFDQRDGEKKVKIGHYLHYVMKKAYFIKRHLCNLLIISACCAVDVVALKLHKIVGNRGTNLVDNL